MFIKGCLKHNAKLLSSQECTNKLALNGICVVLYKEMLYKEVTPVVISPSCAVIPNDAKKKKEKEKVYYITVILFLSLFDVEDEGEGIKLSEVVVVIVRVEEEEV